MCEIEDMKGGSGGRSVIDVFRTTVELTMVIIVDLSWKYPPAQVCDCLVGGFNFSRAWAHHVGTEISHVQAVTRI